MSKVLSVHPVKKNDSIISWKESGVIHKFDSKFEVSDAFVFLSMNKVVAFHFAESHRDKFVGRVFDYQGKLLFDIPFPDLGTGCFNVECLYSWSSAIDNGVKIVFGTDSVSYRDFWFDFDLDKQEYSSSGEAR